VIISCLKINTEEKEEEEEAKKKQIQNRKEFPKHDDANKQTNNASTTVYRKKTEPEPEAIPKFRTVYMRQKTHTQTRSIDRSVQRRRVFVLSCLRRILCKTKCQR
jgi:hypothetical protein